MNQCTKYQLSEYICKRIGLPITCPITAETIKNQQNAPNRITVKKKRKEATIATEKNLSLSQQLNTETDLIMRGKIMFQFHSQAQADYGCHTAVLDGWCESDPNINSQILVPENKIIKSLKLMLLQY